MARNTDDRRQQIKRAALKVIAQHGIVATKMSMIAEAAKVSQGLFYRYFPAKEDLYSTLVEELCEAAHEAIENIRSLPGTAYEQLLTFTETMLEEESRAAFMFIHKARRDPQPPQRVANALAQATEAMLLERIRPIFAKGQAAGYFLAGGAAQVAKDYFQVIESLVVSDAAQLPSAAFLMRLVTAPPKGSALARPGRQRSTDGG